ncbi:MbtH family protein [Kitasatospora sp. NPDC059722]|uniref:MbtH family protein n=1 Tax=unclassified Kitasatospora TaxID=2633591 RepID=UPI00364837B6
MQEYQPVHTVVVNDQEQYSVWPVLVPVPAGWRETGFRGDRAACLAHVAEVWTDLRPLAVR